MRPLGRLAKAAFMAPFLGSLAGWIAVLIFDGFERGWPYGALTLALAMLTAAISAGVGLVAMCVLGLPGHAVLMATNHRHVWGYLVGGAIAGAIVAALTELIFPVGPGSSVEQSFAFGVLLGASTAGFFWLIRRPDRDSANPDTPAP